MPIAATPILKLYEFDVEISAVASLRSALYIGQNFVGRLVSKLHHGVLQELAVLRWGGLVRLFSRPRKVYAL